MTFRERDIVAVFFSLSFGGTRGSRYQLDSSRIFAIQWRSGFSLRFIRSSRDRVGGRGSLKRKMREPRVMLADVDEQYRALL